MFHLKWLHILTPNWQGGSNSLKPSIFLYSLYHPKGFQIHQQELMLIVLAILKVICDRTGVGVEAASLRRRKDERCKVNNKN